MTVSLAPGDHVQTMSTPETESSAHPDEDGGRRMTSRAAHGVNIVVILALVLVTQFANYPANHLAPRRDSGVFLYTGWRMLDGAVPYRDVWDHKPPLVFFINAVGLLAGGGSPWGMWALQLTAAAAAALIGYWALARTFGGVAALFGSFAWLCGFVLLQEGGNFTEVYCLPLQFAALLLFAISEERGTYGWRAWAIGALAGLAFLLRQNLVGLWVALALYIAVTRLHSGEWRRLAGLGARMAAGTACVAAAIVGYLLLTGTLSEFWDAAFAYNFSYADVSFGDRVRSAMLGLVAVSPAGLSVLGPAAWAGCVFGLASRRRTGRGSPLVWLAVVGLPMEIAFSSTSGRSFGHYYVAWLPLLAVALAHFGSTVSTCHSLMQGAGSRQDGRDYGLLRLAPFMLGIVLVPCLRLQGDMRTIPYERDIRAAADYVAQSTRPADTVLVWGAEASINFLARRPCPTRFVYSYPLLMEGYPAAPKLAELVHDLQQRRPALIIDVSERVAKVPPLDADARAEWLAEEPGRSVSPDLAGALGYISAHYVRVDSVGSRSWPVYGTAGPEGEGGGQR